MDYYQRRPDYRRGNYCSNQRAFENNKAVPPCPRQNAESSCPKKDINDSHCSQKIDSCDSPMIFEDSKCNHMHEHFDLGYLEKYYPVAMAYVPWQNLETVYDLEKGLREGTIFPELNLPFLRGGCPRR